ncbi:unnamed protein product [Closterium sp. NIES-54]
MLGSKPDVGFAGASVDSAAGPWAVPPYVCSPETGGGVGVIPRDPVDEQCSGRSRGQVRRRRRDHERRGGGGRRLKLLAHVATGATGTLATGATGTRATEVTVSAAAARATDSRATGATVSRATVATVSWVTRAAGFTAASSIFPKLPFTPLGIPTATPSSPPHPPPPLHRGMCGSGRERRRGSS